jgi:signal transduction histidine kinase
MSRRGARPSLTRRVVTTVLLGELAFGLVLSATIGTLSAVALAEQHRKSTQDFTNAVAAALMPIVADQQELRIAAALENIVDTAGIEGIECIQVIDSSGATIVAKCAREERSGPQASLSSNAWGVLFRNRLVQRVIEVDGLEVATVSVELSPPRLSEVLLEPAIASLLVLGAVMFVSVPWTLWAVVRDVVEPLQELEDYSARLAEGDYEWGSDLQWPREIEQLAGALGSMAAQLRQQQQALQGSYEELSGAYESLERAKGEIEQLAAIKEDFVAVAAHEIRAPLSTIRLYAEALQTEEIGELDDAGMRAVAAIYSAASRLGSITSDLMDSALLERGMMPIKIDVVWLDEVVEEAVRDADTAARARGTTVRQVQDDLPEMVIRADALRLRQVLDNLLSNAIKYSPEGREILVGAEEDEEWVTIEVADEGYGISESDRHRLFRLFGRLDFGESRQAAGLGLGLAISARIVEAHGGTISFHANESGHGSVFRVRLPKNGPSGVGPDGAVIADVVRGRGRHE